jgi:ABC-type amino acid transport substrate-binding protein
MGRWRRGSIVALAVLTVMAAGCAGKKASDSGSPASQRRDVTLGGSQNAVQRRAETTLDAIASRGKLNFVGGTRFAADVAVRITDIIFAGKVPLDYIVYGPVLDPLSTGEADVDVVDWPPEEDRTIYHVSPPLYADSIRLLVPAGAGITTVADLQGKAVGHAGDSDLSAERLRRYLDSKKQTVDIRFEEIAGFNGAVDEMIQGHVSAVVGPASELAPYVKANPGRLVLLSEQYYTWTYNVYVLKQNVELAAAIDKAVRKMTDSGELDQLIEGYGMRI